MDKYLKEVKVVLQGFCNEDWYLVNHRIVVVVGGTVVVHRIRIWAFGLIFLCVPIHVSSE